MPTTIDFLNGYCASGKPGAAALARLLRKLNDPAGDFQEVCSMLAGQMHEGIDPIEVFATWLHDEACGDSARPLDKLLTNIGGNTTQASPAAST